MHCYAAYVATRLLKDLRCCERHLSSRQTNVPTRVVTRAARASEPQSLLLILQCLSHSRTSKDIVLVVVVVVVVVGIVDDVVTFLSLA